MTGIGESSEHLAHNPGQRWGKAVEVGLDAGDETGRQGHQLVHNEGTVGALAFLVLFCPRLAEAFQAIFGRKTHQCLEIKPKVRSLAVG